MTEIKDICRDGATIYQLDRVPQKDCPEGVNLWFANVSLCNWSRPPGELPPREEIAEFLRVAANSHRALVAILKEIHGSYLPEHNPQYQAFDSLEECPEGHEYECGYCDLKRRVTAALTLAGEPT